MNLDFDYSLGDMYFALYEKNFVPANKLPRDLQTLNQMPMQVKE